MMWQLLKTIEIEIGEGKILAKKTDGKSGNMLYICYYCLRILFIFH